MEDCETRDLDVEFYTYKTKCKPRNCKYCNIPGMVKYQQICNKCKLEYIIYTESCKFLFNVLDYPEKFDLKLIDIHGLFSPENYRNNRGGMVKDHMYSIKEGFKNKVSPEMMSHPANCQLLTGFENSKKWAKCTISLDELLKRIKNW